MAEALLIYPYLGDMDIIRSKPYAPLPLVQAASKLALHYQTKILDVRIERSWQEGLEHELEKGPFYVALSVMTGKPIVSALEISSFVKQRCNIPVVWGGHHPTMCPDLTLSDPAVDVVVIGEGEDTLLELTDRYSSGRNLEGVKGLWFKRNGHFIQNEPRPALDLNLLPPTPFHLLDVGQYIYEYGGKTFINIETSRGCNHRCRYCYHTSGNGHHHFRAMNPDKTIEHIANSIKSCRTDGVFIVDDNFFVDKIRGMDTARKIMDQDCRMPWLVGGMDVPTMLSMTSKELNLLEKSNLNRISVGAETGSQKTLTKIRKPQTIDMLIKANRIWSQVDIKIYYSWMAGFPGETIDDVKQTVDIMLKIIKENSRARTSPIYNFIPLPGTELWNEVIENYGFCPPDSLEQWAKCDASHVNVPYMEASMKKTLNNLYFPSLFMDKKFEDYGVPAWLALAARAYRPVARARMRSKFYHFPIEKWAGEKAELFFPRRRRS